MYSDLQSIKQFGVYVTTDWNKDHSTEGRMGEQASLEFDLTFGDVLLHKLVQAY